MPSADTLLAFCVAAFVLIIIPGPSVLFVVGRSLSWGRRAGIASVIGNALGVVPMVFAVAFGVGAIIAQSVVLFTLVKVIGGIYLFYLGIQAIRHRRDDDATEAVAGKASSRWTMLRQGFVVGATNPKSAVFLVAVLPQFVDVHAGPASLQMLLLGAIFLTIAVTSDGLWAVMAGTARNWFASDPGRLARVRGTGGGLMLGLAASLLFAGNKA